ncbi:MAG: MATE family efflux transporter [Bacilli bacterium]|nr:MATE family efflux transporter [Bacilli bacterium]
MKERKNKMAEVPMKKLFWMMGFPMIISMVLQALYNVVDSVFIANMKDIGPIANQALTIAFPIQILIIAIGVGTGVGLNALLSKSLGEKDSLKVNKVAGNGIFLSICIYIVFLLFGLFGSRWFIELFAQNNEVIEMGTTYLKICTTLSLGAIGYTVYERLLQSTGKTLLSTIAQISGAVTNVLLDYIFIYPMNMGVAGAAWATIIGQFVSLFIAMIFHYTMNKEINGNIKYIKPNISLIKSIYRIGVSAAIMQALLSVMMAGMNAILSNANADPVVLVGSFGIYYKISQIALFSSFGLSNTIISILSFNYGMKDKERIEDSIKYGIIDTVIVTFVISILFELFATPLSNLFGLSGGSTDEIIRICALSLRIASIGYVFMGFSIAIQGILQSLGYALKPLIISLLRLVIFVFPIAYLFTLSNNVSNIIWWTFPITEVLTSFISFFILKNSYKEKVKVISEIKTSDKLIISISREHGTNGKEIARLVAKKLNIAFYDKEEIKEYALKHSLIDTENEDQVYNYYLSLDGNKDSIIKQAETIKMIAQEGNSVIVGRAADYFLKDNPNLIKIFLYAPLEYRINKIKELYKDNTKKAKENINKSDKSRSSYYEVISNQVWGDKENYDLCLNASIGNEKIVDIICDYIKKNRK